VVGAGSPPRSLPQAVPLDEPALQR